MDKWTAGGIFFAGMATTYLLQKTKVLGAENRVFNSTSCPYWEPQSLTPDGYETNAPQGYTGPYYTITENPYGYAWNHWKVTKPDGTVMNHRASLLYAKQLVQNIKGTDYWKDMQNSATPQTSCPNCCVVSTPPPPPPPASTSGSSGSGGSSSTQNCPACDSCCPTVTCPECMDCPAPTKCDSCCPPCQDETNQATFLSRLFSRTSGAAVQGGFSYPVTTSGFNICNS